MLMTKTRPIYNWGEIRKVLKHQHPELRDEDLVYEPGKEHELIERISRRTQLSYNHTCEFIERLDNVL